jgi:hypothetical protein
MDDDAPNARDEDAVADRDSPFVVAIHPLMACDCGRDAAADDDDDEDDE